MNGGYAGEYPPQQAVNTVISGGAQVLNFRLVCLGRRPGGCPENSKRLTGR
jgi:hypothetical protein